MFLNIDSFCSGNTAIQDDSGHTVTYGELCGTVRSFGSLSLPRCVVFCLCENAAGSLIGYLALENNGQVPLLLSAGIDREFRDNLEKIYQPSYYWLPERLKDEVSGETILEKYGYILKKTVWDPYPIHKDLSLLLTTSGSTGSPKLVRHKYGNLESNAANVSQVFGWTSKEIGICDLPMNYTMGLNVINSHLITGASVLLVKANLMDPDFWTFIKDWGGTNFCGVPFSYEIMRRIGFDKMDLPALRTFAQGGGKLTDKMFKWIASWCRNNGRRFCATFGTSETSARMSFLDPDLALQKVGSIGKAIPNGEMFLIDEITDEEGFASGELGYRGPNVTMGYAYCKDDLTKEDEFCGEYHTGDIARRDPEGFYFIIGRKGRFLKLFGIRVSLDETERILKSEFPDCEFVCLGDDKRMNIFATNENIKDEIIPFISHKTNLHNSAFCVYNVDRLPRNEFGKVLFKELQKLVE